MLPCRSMVCGAWVHWSTKGGSPTFQETIRSTSWFGHIPIMPLLTTV